MCPEDALRTRFIENWCKVVLTALTEIPQGCSSKFLTLGLVRS